MLALSTHLKTSTSVRNSAAKPRWTRWRQRVHLGFAALFLTLVLVFKWVDNASMIGVILKLASYTYGPLLGLFAFGILTRRTLADRLVPIITVGAPLLCALLEFYQEQLLGR